MKIYVSVKPNSNENNLEKIGEDEYLAKVKEPADKNKANVALIKLLSKEFSVSHKDIRIINPISRRKIIEIVKN